MTKRAGFFETGSHKKPRPSENIDDLWGDDFDVSAIDDCIELATQQVYKQENIVRDQTNESIMPSYNAFKHVGGMLTSTQTNIPSTSKFPMPASVCDLQKQVAKLQAELQVKEGEVAVLRSKLQTEKADMESELVKRQKEWSEKLTKTVKDMNATKTELEFKNLEIMNLKQKVLEVSKVGDFSFMQKTIVESKKEVPSVTNILERVQEMKLDDQSYTVYPLRKVVPNEMYNCLNKEIWFVSPHHVFYNKSAQTDKATQQDVEPALKYIFPEIKKLSDSSERDLESHESSCLINKILCVIIRMLHIFHEFLTTAHEQSPTTTFDDTFWSFPKETECANIDVCIFDERKMCENEVAVDARRGIAFVAELVPYNTALRNYIIENMSLNVEVLLGEKCSRLLSLLLSCIKLIRELQRAREATGFLCSCLKLLSSLYATAQANVICPELLVIFQQIVLCKPNSRVILEMSFCLRYSSQDSSFVNHLCRGTVKGSTPNEIDDACVFYIVALELSSVKLETRDKLTFYRNLLAFLYNIVARNPEWLYYQEHQLCCSCLYQFTQLCVDVAYNCVQTHTQTDRHDDVFRLASKLIYAVNFRLYSLIEKSVLRYARYRATVRLLLAGNVELGLQVADVELLQRFTEEDDVRNVASDTVDKCQLWDIC